MGYAALEGPLFHGDARRLGFLRPCFFRSRSSAPSGLVRPFFGSPTTYVVGCILSGWVVATSAGWSVRSWPFFPGASCSGAKARFVLGWVTRPLKGRSSTVMRGLWDCASRSASKSPLPANSAGSGAPFLSRFGSRFFIFLGICLRCACQKIPIRRLGSIGAFADRDYFRYSGNARSLHAPLDWHAPIQKLGRDDRG